MGGPDQESRRRERRWVGSVMLIALFVGLAGGIAGNVIGSDEPLDPIVLWLALAVAAGIALVSGGLAVAFVAWRRRHGPELFARSPLADLPRRERAALVRALRRGDPIPPRQRDVARHVAADFGRYRGPVWLFLVVAVVFGAILTWQDGWEFWFWLGMALLYLGIAGHFAWLSHRMRLAVARLDEESARGA